MYRYSISTGRIAGLPVETVSVQLIPAFYLKKKKSGSSRRKIIQLQTEVTSWRVSPRRMNTYTLSCSLTPPRSQEEWTHEERLPCLPETRENPVWRKSGRQLLLLLPDYKGRGGATTSYFLPAPLTPESPVWEGNRRLFPTAPSAQFLNAGHQAE